MRPSSIQRATQALALYPLENNQEALTDLLTDLMLWANIEDESVNFDEALSMATDHFAHEVNS